ncbi:MAG TPA: pyridoxamine 5'-phosphate oxidase family protein [Acidimicrobiales bacterium]|nr:pyridoxamine 5'-phosphate oxidase family protein [Acidimicrobiales bacterium]
MTLPPPQETHASDLARRIAHRRNELGMSVEELATRTGIDPGYLAYFERSADATLSGGTMLLMALALQTTPLSLLGGEVDRPPGHGRAGPHPDLVTLTPQQCEAHLSAGGVGRVVFSSPRGPVALPVNFEFTEGEVVFSTDEDKASSLGAAEVVGFEIDRVDEAVSEGWSVLVTGRCRHIEDPEEVQRLASLDLESWAGGDRHALVGIRPDELTGRVIVHLHLPDQD